MPHPATAALAALALCVAAPACTILRPPDLPNPIADAKTPDQKALALIESYAAILEEATDLVAHPETPAAVRQALARAERAATPAIDVLRIAMATHLRAEADWQAAQTKDRSVLERASAALAIAGVRLSEAIAQASAPISALQTLVTQEKRG